jgi:hypothetical protein
MDTMSYTPKGAKILKILAVLPFRQKGCLAKKNLPPYFVLQIFLFY